MMNAEMMVVSHPYYAVTDQDGRFELTDVPPGDYEVVAWHEGWHVRVERMHWMYSARKQSSGLFSANRGLGNEPLPSMLVRMPS